jgi:hypothetical protein
MRYGICPNSEHRCQFSYRSQSLAQVHDCLQRIQARESQGKDVSAGSPDLKWCTKYFQSGKTCQGCGETLFMAIVSTTDLDLESDEYQRRIKLNHLLALTGELQARGILRV